MKKDTIESQIHFFIMREGAQFVAYSPALDMATSGRTYAEVQRRSKEIVEIFIEETLHHGTMDAALQGLGWTKVPKSAGERHPHWVPPHVVGQITQPIHIPASARA